MHALRHGRDLPFVPTPNEMWLVLDDLLPPAPLITSALTLAFDSDQRLLMTQLAARGWDIPGGHVEPGETPEMTLRREVMEETGATLGHVRVLGYQHIRLLCEEPPAYRYPYPDSYQVFFLAHVDNLHPFDGTAEARARDLFAPAEAATRTWVRENRDLYDAALAQWQQLNMHRDL